MEGCGRSQFWDWISFTTTFWVCCWGGVFGNVPPLPALVLHVTFHVTLTVRLSGALVSLGALDVTLHADVAWPFTAAHVWPLSPKPVVADTGPPGLTVTLVIVAWTLAQIVAGAAPKSRVAVWVAEGSMPPVPPA